MLKVKRTLFYVIVLSLAISRAAAGLFTNPPTGTTSGGTASCPSSKYRSIDSSCSSRISPGWGRAGEPYARLLPPNYADGISSPPVMSNGSEYVSARTISYNVFSIDEIPDPNNSLVNIFLLQAIGNDLSSPADSDPPVSCCVNGQVVPNAPSQCFPVPIASDDALYSFFNIRCLNYVRMRTASQQPAQPVQQINSASGLLDLSFLYGTSVAQSNRVRAFSGGKLKAVRRNGAEWPPIDPAGCSWANVCYLVADRRSYQFPMSATMHLIFLREHNRVANQLKLLNTNWSDEVLFQEARRINIAQYQYIVYYEYLPRVLGRANMISNRLIFEGTGFASDFSAFQNPSPLGEFGGVLVPYMQSQLPGSINSYVNGTVQSTPLSSLAGNLASLESKFSTFFTGLTTQSTNLMDSSFSIEWKNFMYRGSEALGQDYLALDIQRMRDFGFARYNDYRSRCGLSRIATWEAYNATFKLACPKTIDKLRLYYPTMDDLDLFVGAAFEEPIAGSLMGPTFFCLFKQQFLATRSGDRYFFEAGGQEGSFTVAQLTEIRKTRLSRLMCNAFPTVSKIQSDAFCPAARMEATKADRELFPELCILKRNYTSRDFMYETLNSFHLLIELANDRVISLPFEQEKFFRLDDPTGKKQFFRCYGQHLQSLGKFGDSIRFLEAFKLLSTEDDVPQDIIQLLNVAYEHAGPFHDTEFNVLCWEKDLFGTNDSRSISCEVNDGKLVAKRDFHKGDVLFIEKPITGRVDRSMFQCNYCTLKKLHTIPCMQFCEAYYCSVECLRKDEHYHKYECPAYQIEYFPVMENTLALRMLVKTLDILKQNLLLRQHPLKKPVTPQQLWKVLLENHPHSVDFLQVFQSCTCHHFAAEKELFRTVLQTVLQLMYYILNYRLLEPDYNVCWENVKEATRDLFLESVLLRLLWVTKSQSCCFKYQLGFDQNELSALLTLKTGADFRCECTPGSYVLCEAEYRGMYRFPTEMRSSRTDYNAVFTLLNHGAVVFRAADKIKKGDALIFMQHSGYKADSLTVAAISDTVYTVHPLCHGMLVVNGFIVNDPCTPIGNIGDHVSIWMYLLKTKAKIFTEGHFLDALLLFDRFIAVADGLTYSITTMIRVIAMMDKIYDKAKMIPLVLMQDEWM
uniref:MYND-type domain-containing protein n=1 Tax=Anopheles minimus TaxID=112268 RepID=A0A182WDD1_9DIPT